MALQQSGVVVQGLRATHLVSVPRPESGPKMLADIEAGRDEVRYSKRAKAEREHCRKLCRETLAAASIGGVKTFV